MHLKTRSLKLTLGVFPVSSKLFISDNNSNKRNQQNMLVNSMTEERQEEKKDVTELNNYP